MGIRKPLPTLPVKDLELSIALAELGRVLNPVLKDCSRRVDVPSTSSASGEIGSYALDSSYIYLCVDKDTWKRIALSSW